MVRTRLLSALGCIACALTLILADGAGRPASAQNVVVLVNGDPITSFDIERSPLEVEGGMRVFVTSSVAVVAGLVLACIGLFWINRLLPVELAQRADWELRCLRRGVRI